VTEFNYDGIPKGYYDTVMECGSVGRRFWHRHKFLTVKAVIGDTSRGGSILDVGCFAGSFLKLLDRAAFTEQLGVDILEQQIAYANEKYGTEFRRFEYVPNISKLQATFAGRQFDVLTCIEVIEHLRHDEIRELFAFAARALRAGGRLIVSTPNYFSIWPLLEYGLNRFSDVSYEEQHVTKFTYLDLERKLRSIYPDLDRQFRVVLKTTSHFLAPWLAMFSERLARRVSELVRPKRWRFPFGALCILSLEKIVAAEG